MKLVIAAVLGLAAGLAACHALGAYGVPPPGIPPRVSMALAAGLAAVGVALPERHRPPVMAAMAAMAAFCAWGQQ